MEPFLQQRNLSFARSWGIYVYNGILIFFSSFIRRVYSLFAVFNISPVAIVACCSRRFSSASWQQQKEKLMVETKQALHWCCTPFLQIQHWKYGLRGLAANQFLNRAVSKVERRPRRYLSENKSLPQPQPYCMNKRTVTPYGHDRIDLILIFIVTQWYYFDSNST